MSTALRGTIRYEFAMQARRPAVWIVLALALAAVLATTRAPFQMPHVTGARALAGTWAMDVQALAPAAFGCLLADRVLREARMRVAELVGSLPAAPAATLLGKYVGAVGATLLPIAAVYAAGAVYLAAAHGWAVLPWALGAFALVNLPGLLFVGAFSIGCPSVMPVAVYQFLFVGYWFWGNWLPTTVHIPTISHTILTPIGGYAASLLGAHGFGLSGVRVAAASAWASVAVLLVVSAAALVATGALLRARAASEATGTSSARTARARTPVAAGPAPWRRVRYELRILGRGVVLTPLIVVAVFAAFALLSVVTSGGSGQGVPRILTAALEIGLSLGAGLAAANVVAAEPAVELHLSLGRGYRPTALTRLGLTVLASCALGFLLSCVMAATGTLLTSEPFGASQLTWASPILWMAAAGAVLALVMRSRAGSVGVITGLWVAEMVLHGLFRSKLWLRPFELFATDFARGAPWWLTNRLELLAGALVLFALAWLLLGNSEPFVGSAQE